MPIIDLNNEQNLANCVDNHEIVVIDFWAPWCGPCRGFVSVLEHTSQRHPDIVFCRVNTGEQDDLAQAFEVEVIPTVVVIRDGIVVASQSGLLPEDALEQLIEQARQLDVSALRSELAAALSEQSESN